ncbi:RNA polymerase sigma factor [Sporosarcina trichiuri]|uniref:RNA polymerase sigma factor n=1 Tax=Sporosarcina trichiuri TaxID=3056445 RepID=UPI0025B485F9|nr:sigma-70 family RNA polymerase sigma factor [Sporosarcina sp. 0.2-SM1T-5]WJY27594.1 sigma-70 family RNA polymerase sigma factor [Sporosarcina sp. 0.2-SM1T-5]
MDSRTIEQVIGEYSDYLLRVAFVYVKNQNTAEDIVQDVFIRFYQHGDQFRNGSSLKTYLVRMTVNRSHDHLRSFAHTRMILTDRLVSLGRQRSPETITMDKEVSQDVLSALLALKTQYREVLALYYYDDWSTVEIAEILGCPEATVRTRLQRARRQLKDKLEQQEGFSHGFD